MTPELPVTILCSRETALGFVLLAAASGRIPAHALITSSGVSKARGK
jgi:hypothetical protein